MKKVKLLNLVSKSVVRNGLFHVNRSSRSGIGILHLILLARDIVRMTINTDPPSPLKTICCFIVR